MEVLDKFDAHTKLEQNPTTRSQVLSGYKILAVQNSGVI